jgi:glycosyltransferase involved in cell wall biosynthesis
LFAPRREDTHPSAAGGEDTAATRAIISCIGLRKRLSLCVAGRMMRASMSISVVIPVYNEKNTIHEILKRVRQSPVNVTEIVLVDDCSRDGTRAILEKYYQEAPFKLLLHSHNQGKGAALRTGFAAATGEIVIVQDADLEYNPAEYPALLEPILNGNADVVFGSRFQGGGPHRVVFYRHMLGNKFLTTLSNLLTNLNLTDMECCYKIFRREVLEQIRIEEDRFGVEPELTAKVAKLGVRCYEVGVSYYGRTYFEGKKIHWKDGVRAIYAILKYNLFR